MHPKVYFKGFNGLRFFAAYLVVIFHTELVRKKYELFNLLDYTLWDNGAKAVEFFFVLSGFLITFLLMSEYEKYKTISIKNFYIRRILRIWPLYYMIIIIGLLIIPKAIGLVGVTYEFPFPIGKAAALYILFLPNLVTSLYGSSFLHPLWSIGVEEQFYLIWAPLVKFFKKHLVVIFISIIGLRMGFYAYHHAYPGTEGTLTYKLLWFFDTMKFESMALGGLGAYLLFYNREKILGLKVFNKLFQVIFLALLIARLCFHKYLIEEESLLGSAYSILFDSPVYSTVISSLLFLWLLINISSNPKTIVNTENKLLDFLGSISYGIYMYHTIVIFIVGIFVKEHLRNMSPFVATLTLYSFVLLLTVLVAYISFEYIEKKFLKLKDKAA